MHKLQLMFTKYEVIRWTRVEVISIFVSGIILCHPALDTISY